MANVVELKTFGGSAQVAQDCAQGVFDLIKITQAKIDTPYIEQAKIKLADAEDRLAKAKELLTKADKSGSAIDAIYLSTRDEIRYLLDEITALKNIVTTNQPGYPYGRLYICKRHADRAQKTHGARGWTIWRAPFRTPDSLSASVCVKAKERSWRCTVILGGVQASA